MPKINLKYKETKRRISSKINNDNHRYVYNTDAWRKLRLIFLAENPLCNKCEKEGRITLAEEVHHKIPISQGRTKEQKQQLGFNINNLQALCVECHKKIDKDEYKFN
jgi:5-methylcytosine-specific restriction protein A